ncbi:oligoendopeptidase F [Pullulanibacillus pueri]|uniref:Oligopeptidase F n=1 Tax=Pullulanibacillus pueri TaxID=1437324 RepID=A0A8J2ZWS6_9BACL|nr:oligoendopeptidase F [Pullulanibacillus pueri]MBM7680594.1 oligoendopeptidase F [Pullulanibacillus pueri]GGH83992.1 oligoendopeptidase F [Pullulanibacillus pueri]
MAEQGTKALLTREEVQEQEKWNLEAIYPDIEAWEADFNQVKALIPEVTAFKGKLSESSQTLYDALQKQDELTKTLSKLFAYSHMKADEDTANPTYQALNDRTRNLAAAVGSQLSFVVPEILSLDEQKLKQFIEENDDLKLYRHALDEINRERPHVLSEEKEALLAEASEVLSASSNTFGMLNNADMTLPKIKGEDGEEVQVTHGRYSSLIRSQNRQVREDAFKAMHGTYESFKNTFASTLGTAFKRDNFYARVRNYDSARQAALSANNIPEEVYDNLVSTVNDHLHLLHRYVELRKRAMKLEDLHMYDLYTPLVKDVDMKVSYEEAKALVLKGLAPMGEEYVNIIQEGYNNRWIDVRETKNKRSGAYSSGTYGTMPYILLNWSDEINDAFTLAHELGHSLHSYYTRKNQPYPYADYSIFVAEVASTCNEALLNHYLLNETNDKKQKLYLLNNQLEGFRGTVFRQTMFAEFEKIAHEKAANGEALTSELLSSVYYDLNKKYFGEGMTIDKEIAIEWARIPHFYNNFYVYQYSTGYSAAAALSQQILNEGEPAVTRYKEFLKAGSSDYPIEVLKRAGVDMTSPDPIKQAFKVFENVLNEMESLLF